MAGKRLVGWFVGWAGWLAGCCCCCWVLACLLLGHWVESAKKKAGMEVPVHGWKEWGGMQVQHMSRDDANGIHAHQEATHISWPSGGS